MNSLLEEKLKEDKDFYASLDVLKLTISGEYLVNVGSLRSKEACKKMSESLLSCLLLGKNPGLNPCFDLLHEYKEREPDPVDAAALYVLENSEFELKDVDNKKSYLKISTPIDILWLNLEPFLAEKSLVIEKAFIKTALFEKEIK